MTGRSGGQSSGVRQPVVLALALAALVVAAYAVAVSGGFLWDDDLHVTANPTIIGPLGLREIWTTARANYFPLVLTNFWIQHALWGLNPVGYHLVTLGSHVIAAFLLWRVLWRLRVPAAWLGAALWAVHPVQVESVAWICELKNTQSAVFFFLAIACWLEALDAATDRRPQRAWYLATLGCAVLALLSKPSTVMLPVVLALCTWWQTGRWTWRDAWRLAPFFALSAVAAGWAVWEQKFHSGAMGEEWNQSAMARGLIAGRAIWFYLGKLLWPQGLAFVYPRWAIDVAQPLAYIPPLLAVAAGAWLWRRRAAWRGVFLAGGYFAALLFPVLGFFDVYFFRYSFVGDHFQYLASVGPLTLFAAGLALAFPRRWPIAGAAVLGGLALLTAVQAGDYRSQETLWRATVTRNPGAAMAWAQLGSALEHDARHGEATACFERALRINPDHPEARNHLGVERLLAGRTDDAMAEFQRALVIRPDFPAAHGNLGVALLQAGRPQEAVPHLKIAAQAASAPAEIQTSLGKALAALGRWDDAVESYQTALAHGGDSPALHEQLGEALMEAGRPVDAVPHYEISLRAHLDDPAAQCNLANALRSSGRLPDAVARYEEALRLEPNRAETHDGFGLALAAAGRAGEAIAEFERAIQLRPALASAHNNLGATLAQTGQVPAALLRFDEAVRLDANYAAAHLNRGIALATLDRLPDACAAFARAVELQPGSAKAHAYFGQVLGALGRESQAKQELGRAAELERGASGRP